MKQRLFLIILGGFFAAFLVQFSIYFIDWYFSSDGGTVYDYWSMVLYFGPIGAALFSMSMTLAAVFYLDRLEAISLLSLALTTFVLAVVSAGAAFLWGHYVVPDVLNTGVATSFIGDLLIQFTPLLIIIAICFVGVRFAVARTS